MLLSSEEEENPQSPVSDSSVSIPRPVGTRHETPPPRGNGVSPLPALSPPPQLTMTIAKARAEGEDRAATPDQVKSATPLRPGRPLKSPVQQFGTGCDPKSPLSGTSQPRTAAPFRTGSASQVRPRSHASLTELADPRAVSPQLPQQQPEDSLESAMKEDMETGPLRDFDTDSGPAGISHTNPHQNGHTLIPDHQAALQYSFSSAKPASSSVLQRPSDAHKCRLTGICKSLLGNAVLILVYLTVTCCYTLGGGAILVSLDEQYYRDQAAALKAGVLALGFNKTQIAFLAANNIPPAPPQYSIWDGQQYALQLVTTIGYGNITSQTAAARWFAFFYSFIGIILVGYALVQMGPCMFQLIIDVLMLCAAALCIVRFRAGQAELWSQQVKVKYAYAFMDNDDAPPLSLWDLRCIMTEVSPDHPPDWGTVCAVVSGAGVTKKGLVCRAELEKVVKLYACHIGQLQQNEWQSVLFFKMFVLILWMMGGAWFYTEICPCLYGDYGSSVYYVLITLTTIGTGDFYPCDDTCEAFWFFHTACGLGMMTVVTYLLGLRLQGMFQAAQSQRIELSTEYGYVVRCRCLRRGFRRLSAFSDMVRGVGFIMAYVAIGGAVFSEFEEQVPDPPPFMDTFSHLGLTPSQLQFVESFAPADSTWSFAIGMRYSLESITTIGYGDYSLRTGGARTFAVFYILLGLGMIGVQLESLGEASRVLLHLLFDTFTKRMKWEGVSMQRDDQLIAKLTDLLDHLEQLSRRPEGVTMADLQQQVELAGTVSGIQTEMLEAMLGVSGMEAQLVHVDASCASVSLARLYHRVVVRRAVRELVGGSLVLLVVILISLPVFVYTESWSVGDAAWFCYITTTTIGLGDYATTSTLGLVWWYFLVFITIGQLSVFFPSMVVVWRGVVVPRLRRRRRLVASCSHRPQSTEFPRTKAEAKVIIAVHNDRKAEDTAVDGIAMVPTPDPMATTPQHEPPDTPEGNTTVVAVGDDNDGNEDDEGPTIGAEDMDMRLILSSSLPKGNMENTAG